MRYLDLTHTFTANMPVYPGDPVPEFVQVADLPAEFSTQAGHSQFRSDIFKQTPH